MLPQEFPFWLAPGRHIDNHFAVKPAFTHELTAVFVSFIIAY